MSKKFLVKLLGVLIIASSAVLWLLSEVNSETFGFFNLAWAGVLLAGGLGTLLVLVGLFEKNAGPLKKMKIWFGISLLIAGFVCLISAIVIPNNIILPIIAIIVVAGLLISLLATGGKSWDESDNHKVGYKNYFERKKEENSKK